MRGKPTARKEPSSPHSDDPASGLRSGVIIRGNPWMDPNLDQNAKAYLSPDVVRSRIHLTEGHSHSDGRDNYVGCFLYHGSNDDEEYLAWLEDTVDREKLSGLIEVVWNQNKLFDVARTDSYPFHRPILDWEINFPSDDPKLSSSLQQMRNEWIDSYLPGRIGIKSGDYERLTPMHVHVEPIWLAREQKDLEGTLEWERSREALYTLPGDMACFLYGPAPYLADVEGQKYGWRK